MGCSFHFVRHRGLKIEKGAILKWYICVQLIISRIIVNVFGSFIHQSEGSFEVHIFFRILKPVVWGGYRLGLITLLLPSWWEMDLNPLMPWRIK